MPPRSPPQYTADDVRRFRAQRDWKLEELAEFLGYSKGHLSRIERGVSPITDHLRMILHIRGVKHSE